MRNHGVNSRTQSLALQGHTNMAQLRMDALYTGFSREAGSAASLFTVAGAGLSYQLGRTLTIGVFSQTSSRYAGRLLAPLVGLNFEVGTLHGIHHFTNANIATENTNGFRSYLSTLIDVGALKGLGAMSLRQSQPVQQMVQSFGMAGIHRTVASTGLVPHMGSDSFFEDVLNAEVLNLEMGASGVLARRMGAGHLSNLERSLHTYQNVRISILETMRASVAQPPGRFAEFQGMAREQWRAHGEGIRNSARELAFEYFDSWSEWTTPRCFHLPVFERMYLALDPSQRRAKFQVLTSYLKDPSINPAREKFLENAIKFSFQHLADEHIESALRILSHRFNDESITPMHRRRLLTAFQHGFYRFDAAQKIDVATMVMGEMLRPVSNLREHACDVLLQCLSHLQREQLIQMAASLNAAPFSPLESMSYVERSFNSIFNQMASRRRADHQEADIVEELQLLGSFLPHAVFHLGFIAHNRLLKTAQLLPEAVSQPELISMLDWIPSDLLCNLRWGEEFERRQGDHDASLPLWMRAWERDRSVRVLSAVCDAHKSLALPAEWTALRAKAAQVLSLQDIVEFRNLMRQHLLATQPADVAITENWWNNATMAQRWLALQFCVGSRRYWALKGREAMRMRRFTFQGLENETGVASTQPVVLDNDNVFFLLGDPSSVGVPYEFVQDKGFEQARRYMLVHHTHPSRGPRDFNQIYPSTQVEGVESGDLYAMLNFMSQLNLPSPVAFSLTHEDGGSIFVMRQNERGDKHLDVYSARRAEGEAFDLNHSMLRNVRDGITRWSTANHMNSSFWEVPFEWVENMRYPDAPVTHPSAPVSVADATRLH